MESTLDSVAFWQFGKCSNTSGFFSGLLDWNLVFWTGHEVHGACLIYSENSCEELLMVESVNLTCTGIVCMESWHRFRDNCIGLLVMRWAKCYAQKKILFWSALWHFVKLPVGYDLSLLYGPNSMLEAQKLSRFSVYLGNHFLTLKVCTHF